jgi:hypothetical protein
MSNGCLPWARVGSLSLKARTSLVEIRTGLLRARVKIPDIGKSTPETAGLDRSPDGQYCLIPSLCDARCPQNPREKRGAQGRASKIWSAANAWLGRQDSNLGMAQSKSDTAKQLAYKLLVLLVEPDGIEATTSSMPLKRPNRLRRARAKRPDEFRPWHSGRDVGPSPRRSGSPSIFLFQKRVELGRE